MLPAYLSDGLVWLPAPGVGHGSRVVKLAAQPSSGGAEKLDVSPEPGSGDARRPLHVR